MKVAENEKYCHKVLVLALLFNSCIGIGAHYLAKVMLSVLTIVFTRTVNIPASLTTPKLMF